MVARFAQAFGMCLIFDPNLKKYNPTYERINELTEIFERADIITMHVPHEKKQSWWLESVFF